VCASSPSDACRRSYVPSLQWNGGAPPLWGLLWLAVRDTESDILVANVQIRCGVSNSLETYDITLLLLLWLLPVREAATHVSALLLWSCTGGIISETLTCKLMPIFQW
jgi:hypothetical protein